MAFIQADREQMYLRSFYAKYRADGGGHPAYDPGLMVTLLLYSHCLANAPAGGSSGCASDRAPAAGRRSGRLTRTRGCASEWKLICATHNLLKLWNCIKARVRRGETREQAVMARVCWA